jgi:carboxylate-amine ligase
VLLFRPRRSARDGARAGAGWTSDVAGSAWTVGLEEQVMVLDPRRRWALVADVSDVVAGLPGALSRSVAVEADAGRLELVTAPCPTVAAVTAELGHLRTRLTAALGRLDLRAAAAGSHPGAAPTFAMHVHIGVPDAERAVVAYRRLRAHVPMLVALSANSPFLAGRETGLASARAQALTDDLRVCDRHGAVELRTMDAQMRLRDVAALAALAQCLVRHEATRDARRGDRFPSAQVAQDDRRRALTSGMRARLHDPRSGEEVPAQELLARVVDTCGPHAQALGCETELEGVLRLGRRPGDTVQRSLARLRPGEPSGGRRLRNLTCELSAAFTDA